MTPLFSALLTGLLASSLALTTPAVFASETGAPAVKKVTKKKPNAHKPAVVAAPAAYELAAPDDDDTGAIIDLATAPAIEYKCELGNTLTIFRNDGDDNYIALRWHKIVTRMKRVATTTGAHRFENKRSGLVWIGIPAKGLLLDSRKGQQLANECKDPAQMALASGTGETSS